MADNRRDVIERLRRLVSNDSRGLDQHGQPELIQDPERKKMKTVARDDVEADIDSTIEQPLRESTRSPKAQLNDANFDVRQQSRPLVASDVRDPEATPRLVDTQTQDQIRRGVARATQQMQPNGEPKTQAPEKQRVRATSADGKVIEGDNQSEVDLANALVRKEVAAGRQRLLNSEAQIWGQATGDPTDTELALRDVNIGKSQLAGAAAEMTADVNRAAQSTRQAPGKPAVRIDFAGELVARIKKANKNLDIINDRVESEVSGDSIDQLREWLDNRESRAEVQRALDDLAGSGELSSREQINFAGHIGERDHELANELRAMARNARTHEVSVQPVAYEQAMTLTREMRS